MDRPTLHQTPFFAVLLLHGLYAKADELKAIATKLHKQFGKAVLVMQPTCRTRLKSVIRSIDQQAEDMLKWITITLINYGKEPSSFPLIIIGYSQGGVLACTLGNLYKHPLNIVGIITLNAPLMGTPLLERSRRDVQAFISNAEAGLNLIDYPLARIKRSITLQAWMRILTRPRWVAINGLKDIAPNSKCIKDVCSFLAGANHTTPCLLIATHQNDFSALFHLKTASQHRAIEALNHAYALFLTGNKNGRHDTLIPLASQLGREARLKNLMPIDTNLNDKRRAMVGPNRPHIKERIYSGILHARNLVAIDPRLFVEECETVLYSDIILTDIIQFIQELV